MHSAQFRKLSTGACFAACSRCRCAPLSPRVLATLLSPRALHAQPLGLNPARANRALALETQTKADDSCMTMDDVAKAWMGAVSKFSKEDAAAMCVPALVLAAGACYDVADGVGGSKCPGAYDTSIEAEGWDKTLRGLWQIGEGYDPDVRKQAEAVYNLYASDNSDYGCLSQWCLDSVDGCSTPVDGIGQDPETMEHHRFCTGVFSGGENPFPPGSSLPSNKMVSCVR